MFKKSKKIKKLQKSALETPEQSILYLYKKYDFDELALFHSPLSKYVHFSSQGVSTIDWKDQEAVKELTKAILLIKFKLVYWNIPSNFLCPTIPSRINYLEWINTLLLKTLKTSEIQNINGIDIGTGASLIYPILGFKIYGWRFLGTEINQQAYKNAKEIIEKNNFQKNIEIIFSEGGIIEGVIEQKKKFNFLMCNPPFFEDLKEQKTVKWRVSEINKNEAEFDGGETQFIKKIHKESQNFKENIGIFSSLVGRKKDFEELLEYFEKNNENTTLFSTHFDMGKNRRWAIAWKFF